MFFRTGADGEVLADLRGSRFVAGPDHPRLTVRNALPASPTPCPLIVATSLFFSGVSASPSRPCVGLPPGISSKCGRRVTLSAQARRRW